MTDPHELARLADDGCPHEPEPACCQAAADLAEIRRAAAVLRAPWQGPHTTHAKNAVRAVVGEIEA